MTVAYLHPGDMGASIAAATAHPGLWLGSGRSSATRRRAAAAGLADAGTLTALVEQADVIISICPPAAATDVADQVAAIGFDGIYADLNAISPSTTRAIAARFAHFVDGGIVGPPVSGPGTTRLYLSGDGDCAGELARLWTGSALDVRVMDAGAGAASALKCCYASWTKISAALLLAVRAAAEAEGVSRDLIDEWSMSQPDLPARSERHASGTASRAWRFVGEMDEIAEMFAGNGLPDGFARAASEVYRRMAPLKDTPSPLLADVVDALCAGGDPLADL